MLPAIFSLAGSALGSEELAFFREADPAGYILFGRNCRNRGQLRALTDSLRALAGREVPILIDQEGGRVTRLGPPEWPAFPAWWRFAELYRRAPISAIEAARVNAQAIAVTLADAGINVDCLPLLDVRQPGAHDIIGDRALGDEPMQVAALGRAVLDGLAAGGVLGVVKHIPGHGRTARDSHVELPIVSADKDELETDLAPFLALRDAPLGMTAHVVYTAWDRERAATISPVIIRDVIRGRIGFEGLLLSDDVAMGALSGTPGQRAQAVVAAGCDLALHCSGRIEEAQQIANALSDIAPEAQARLEAAMSRLPAASPPQDFEALVRKRDALLAYA